MIPLLLLNLLLTAIYLMLVGNVTFLGALLGFCLSVLIVAMLGQAVGRPGYFKKIVKLLRFAGYFVFILIKANLQVAREIVTPGYQMTPRLIRYPLAGLSDAQITVLANTITLTPGTLSAEIDETGPTLYVHCMYARDRNGAVAELDTLRHRLMGEVFS